MSYFNPRSREGSDTDYAILSPRGSYFNPRSREGSDRISIFGRVTMGISIHAPARGATDKETVELRRYVISIHAPARGATPEFLHRVQTGLFQSTLPRGERHVSYLFLARELIISIHAPARGATIIELME